VLREHCEQLGRDYKEIERTTLCLFDPAKKDEFLASLAAQADLGIDTAILSLIDPTDRKLYDVLARDIVPQAARIAVKGRAIA
jgi:hypothetical protein